ncbi:MAG: hypothetical protein GY804_09510 [Alphaproteobacteria bacterium]|nr:hypothetical protein [Alphaproteobacteria bacterium]
MSKKAEIIKAIVQEYMIVDPSGKNSERMEKKLSNMSNKEFDTFMEDIRDEKESFDLVIPNMKNHLKVGDLLEGCRSVNQELFTRIIIDDPITGKRVMSNEKYLVLNIPTRRPIQSLNLKVHHSNSDTNVDRATGSVIMDDQAARTSGPGAQSLLFKGLNTTLSELLTVRGGNVGMYADFKNTLMETGSCDLNDIVPITRSRVAVTTKNIVIAMGLESTF